MIIIMESNTSEEQVKQVAEKIKQFRLEPHVDKGVTSTLIGIKGATSHISREEFLLDGVKEVKRISKPYKEVSLEFHPQKTIVSIGSVDIGGPEPVIMAGPCAVENRDHLYQTAKKVKEAGAHILRGGAFKPRTSPYSFQGLGEEGLEMLASVKKEVGIPVVSEAMTIEQLPLFDKYDIDIVQVGARNMQNFDLLKALGKIKRPVLLKRGPSSSVEEFLLSAEYILSNGNREVILCERGIRTFETAYRNVLDLNAVALIKRLSHLPIITDPSHGTGVRDLVLPLAAASIAAGANGVIVEAHIDPAKAKCDSKQQLPIEQLQKLIALIKSLP